MAQPQEHIESGSINRSNHHRIKHRQDDDNTDVQDDDNADQLLSNRPFFGELIDDLWSPATPNFGEV